jgi:hypothetical protein
MPSLLIKAAFVVVEKDASCRAHIALVLLRASSRAKQARHDGASSSNGGASGCPSRDARSGRRPTPAGVSPGPGDVQSLHGSFRWRAEGTCSARAREAEHTDAPLKLGPRSRHVRRPARSTGLNHRPTDYGDAKGPNRPHRARRVGLAMRNPAEAVRTIRAIRS